MKMRILSIGDIADVLPGYAFKSSQYSSDGIKLLRGVNVSPESIDWSDCAFWRKADGDGLDNYILQNEDIVIGMDRPWISSGFRIARVGDNDLPSLLVQRVARLRTRQGHNQRYLYYILCASAFQSHLKNLHTETTVPHISHKDIESFKVEMPALSEQRRIADILDKADAIRRKRKQAIALTDQLLRSTFLEMFGDPVTNPKGWPVRRLGDVSILYSGNSLPPGEEYRGQQNGTLLLKVGDMNLPGNEKAIHVAREWSPSTSGCVIAPAGSIIFPKRGGAISTNKKRYLVREVALDPNLMAVSPSEEISTEFLLGWFDLMDLDTISNGSTVPQLNKKDISPLKVFMPPKNTQQTYSVFCMRMAALNRTLAQSLAESERLFESLVDRAFRGELSRTEHVAGQLSMF